MRSDVDVTDRRCVAHRKNGERCKAYAIRGGTVCGKHGGSAPQVKAKAQQRILAAADGAAAKLVALMQDKNVPAQVQLAAARDLLDRAGITSARAFEVEVTAKYEQVLTEVVYDLDDGDAVEAVVVDEPPRDWVQRVDGPLPVERRRRR